MFQKINYNYLTITIKFLPIHMFEHQIHLTIKPFQRKILIYFSFMSILQVLHPYIKQFF